jgi:hypothetical protein
MIVTLRQSSGFPVAVCAAILVAINSSSPVAAAETTVLAQDLLKAGASDKAVSAVWTRRPDSYTLQVVFDPYRYAANPAPVRTQPVSNQPENGPERSSFFIGNTIANLRCMDPAFGGRTLTLVDGRRTVQGQPGAAAAPVQAPQAPPVRPSPRSEQKPEVQVWLLRADGRQILPVLRSPATVTAGECRRSIADEVLFRFDVAESEQAIAVAMRIDDEFHIERLLPLVPGSPQ